MGELYEYAKKAVPEIDWFTPTVFADDFVDEHEHDWESEEDILTGRLLGRWCTICDQTQTMSELAEVQSDYQEDQLRDQEIF